MATEGQISRSFDLADLERILSAVFPDLKTVSSEDIAALKGLLVDIGEQLIAAETAELAWREKADDKLDDIKTRTFGILILQIIKTVKFIFSLLPAGRAVLIGLALFSVLTSYLEGEKVDKGTVSEIMEKTGLSNFLSRIVNQVDDRVNEVISELRAIADQGGNVLDETVTDLEKVITRQITNLQAIRLADVQTNLPAFYSSVDDLKDSISDLEGSANVIANLKVILEAITRGTEDKIRDFSSIIRETT